VDFHLGRTETSAFFVGETLGIQEDIIFKEHMQIKTIYHIQLALVWLGVIAGFFGVMIQVLSGADATGVVGSLGGFFWPLTCLVLIMNNQKLRESQAE
jgi:hypothetical protein